MVLHGLGLRVSGWIQRGVEHPEVLIAIFWQKPLPSEYFLQTLRDHMPVETKAAWCRTSPSEFLTPIRHLTDIYLTLLRYQS